MGKTFSIKVLFGIYLLLMAGKVFAFSCNVDGGSSIGAGTTSVYEIGRASCRERV